MKVLNLLEPKNLVIEEREKPVLKADNDVMVQVKATGICGSDVHIYHGTSPVATYPRVFGHEMVGEITQIGAGVTKVKVGDRVIINQVVNCGTCYACKKNRSNVCHSLKVRGVHIDGGNQEFMCVDEDSVFILPKSISYEKAVLVEPLSIAVQSMSRGELADDDTLLIFGCGALGKSIFKVARLTKATIIVADISADSLTWASANGADYVINLKEKNLAEELEKLTDGYGPTISVDSACTATSFGQIVDVTGNAGRVVTMGFAEKPSDVSIFKITAKELDIRGSRLQNKKFPEVIALLEAGKLDVEGMISHVMPYTKAQEAFDLIDAHDPSVKKIVLTYE